MKINPETRHQNLAQHIKEHLGFIDVDDVKISVIMLVFGLYDVPLLLGFSYILKLEFFWLVIPFVLVIYGWRVRLVIKNKYGTQLEMILFMGLWGALGAISLFLTVLGVLYYAFHITSLISYGILISATALSFYILIKYQMNKFAGDPTKERKSSNQTKYMGLLSASPGLGYLLAQVVEGTDVLEEAISLLVIYIFTIMLGTIAAKFLHRYFFMKANMKYVSYQPITAKERKKIKKQGVEIK